MVKTYKILAKILLVLLLLARLNSVVYCQDSNHDRKPPKIIELPKGCKLVLDSSIDLADTTSKEIVIGICNVIPHVQELIPIDSATVNISVSTENILPVWGIGARTISEITDNHREETVEIYYDPHHPNFKTKNIIRTLVHEFHHVGRIRMPNFQLTLLECMVNEGLADHFMAEVLNCELTPFDTALTDEQIRQNMIRVKPFLLIKFESWTQEFNNNYFVPWMFGRTGDDPIPHWTGYSIGWRIVENYLIAHPDARASSLVWTSPEIIASSTPGLIDSK
jgi:Predicted Zn-dependent protease (DUF2268)